MEAVRVGMSLEDFWRTTPGEVAVAIFGAAERRLDDLEIGAHAVWFGRVISYMKQPDPWKVLPSRSGRKRRSSQMVDAVFTQQEMTRWRRYFQEQKELTRQ